MTPNCVKKRLYDHIDIVLPKLTGDVGPICRLQMKTIYDPEKYSRKTQPEIEKLITDHWEEKTKHNQRLYNASKFRFGGWDIIDGKCLLNVGISSYMDGIGTNYSPHWKEMQEKGRIDFGDPQAYMADMVGVGLLMLTLDNHLVLTKRAAWTGESPNMIDRPGGHPEPDHILNSRGEFLHHTICDVHEAVLQEIWETCEQEVEDEIGIPQTKIVGMRFMGFSFNHNKGARPSLEFFANLNMASREVNDTYLLGQQTEADESTSIHLISPDVTSAITKILQTKISDEKVQKEEAIGTDQSSESTATKSDEDEDILTIKSSAEEILKNATPTLQAALSMAHLLQLI